MTTEMQTPEVQAALTALEQAEIDLKAARQAAAEAVELSRKAEREAKAIRDREERQAIAERNLAMLKGICAPAIAKAEAAGYVVVTPQELTWDCSLTFYKVWSDGQRKRLCYVEYELGAIVVHSGEYQDTKSRYPRRKVGSDGNFYSVAKINGRIDEFVANAIARMDNAAKAKNAEALFAEKYCGVLEAIKAELHLDEAKVNFHASSPGSKHYASHPAECCLSVPSSLGKDGWSLTITKYGGAKKVGVQLHGSLGEDDLITPLVIAKTML